MADNAPTDDAPTDDAEENPGTTRNVQHGRAGRLIQARDIHGDIRLDDGRRRGWLVSVAVLGTAVVVAVMIIAWPHHDNTASGTSEAPSDLRVTADLSYDDQPPWGYVSGSSEFPGADLVSRLAKPNAASDTTVARDLRRTDAAKLGNQIIRLHFQGPRDHAVRITDIRPVIRSKRPPLNGSIVWALPQGEEESSEVQLYLDDQFPVLQGTKVGAAGRYFPTGPFFPSKTINLSRGETHEVVVTSIAHKHSYEYELVVVYQSSTGIQQQVVTDGGRPFRVSGIACTGADIASYHAAYLLRGDFSLRAERNPGHLDAIPGC